MIEAADGPIWSQAGLSNNNWVPRFSVQAKQQVIEAADGYRVGPIWILLLGQNYVSSVFMILCKRSWAPGKSLQAKLLTIRLWK